MSKIQDQTVGTCRECGDETDHTSPEVCWGCVKRLDALESAARKVEEVFDASEG